MTKSAHPDHSGPSGCSTIEKDFRFRTQIKGGTLKFEDAAATHSECPSRANGGSLGWFGRGAMVPEFEQAAFETDIGGYATCTTQFGTHIVRVDGERVLPQVKQMSVNELKELLDNPAEAEECQLVDVREPGEVEAASLSAFSVYSLSLSNKWGQEFFETMDPAKKTVIMCHHGGRSMR